MNSILKSLPWGVQLSCLLGSFLFLAGCQTPGLPASKPAVTATNNAPVQNAESVDLLRPGDVLIITFSGVQDFPPKHEDRVRDDGYITLPFIGPVVAAGKTRAQLQQEIWKKYVPSYFQRLTVNVNSDARYYYVQGEVKRPSNYMFPGTMTVLKAIIAAGDFTDFAKKRRVELIRANGQKPIIVDCIKAQANRDLDLPVYPEDRINVPRRLF